MKTVLAVIVLTIGLAMSQVTSRGQFKFELGSGLTKIYLVKLKIQSYNFDVNGWGS